MKNERENALDKKFHALSNPTRREILMRLSQKPHSAGEIAGYFQITPASISYHLSLLQRSGLICCRQVKKRRIYTVEDLAAKVGVGERFIYRIENEGKKPSYDILYKLIRELSILPDQIFFPEKQIEDSEMENLVRMLYNCDERSMQIIKATVRAALDSQPRE